MLAALIVAVALLCGSAAQPARRPDLIFILVDDLGAANLGYKRDPRWPGNNETQTPNIDRLAVMSREGFLRDCPPSAAELAEPSAAAPLALRPSRAALFVGGRYLKLRRGVPHTVGAGFVLSGRVRDDDVHRGVARRA